MYRSALRSAPRIASPLRQSCIAPTSRRFASTSTLEKRRSWKSSAVRWGLAVGAVYWYSTSSVFAEEPQLQTIQPPPEFSDVDLPTVEAVVAQKRREAEARSSSHKAVVAAPEPKDVLKTETETAGLTSQVSSETPSSEVETHGDAPPEAGGPQALQDEAQSQGAFDPETGEINWDCPCLGGMADGPCGEEFKAAFSCFVYSKEEPKGMDCIDKFQHMQDCFRLHPEVYGDDLAEADEAAAAVDGTTTEGALARDAPSEGAIEADPLAATTKSSSPEPTDNAPTTQDLIKTRGEKEASSSTTPTGSSTPSSAKAE